VECETGALLTIDSKLGELTIALPNETAGTFSLLAIYDVAVQAQLYARYLGPTRPHGAGRILSTPIISITQKI
jgi:hypothetical protein